MADNVTSIADVFVPEIVIPGVANRSKLGTSLVTSPVVVRTKELDLAASGAGVIAKIPAFGPLRALSEIQKERTAPGRNKITTVMQAAPILERVLGYGSTALARVRSAQDPLGAIASMVADGRNYDRQATLLKILEGVFGTSGAGAFAALRNDHFLEAGLSATADNLIDSDMMIDAAAKLGELKDMIERGGAIWCHTDIEAALNKQDKIQTVHDSAGKFVMKTYKGLPLFTSNMLFRVGTTNGKVYTTYLLAPGTIGIGDKPQSSQVGDTASLLKKEDEDTNDVSIYDRTRSIIHPNGAKWKGTPAGESATNAELATEGNWELGVSDVETVGIVQIKTNG